MYAHKNISAHYAFHSSIDQISVRYAMYVRGTYTVHQTNGGNPDARHEEKDQGPRAYKLSKRNPDRNLWNSSDLRSCNDDALSEVSLSLSLPSFSLSLSLSLSLNLPLSLLLRLGVTRYTP